MGEDVGAYGGCYAVSKGLMAEFGETRIRDVFVVKAPISGRVGSILQTPGNMVKANDAQPMLIIALLYREHEKVMTDTENRDQILDGEMTRAQRTAVARSTVEPKPSPDATRREVHEWLKGDPLFHRPRTDESGWFEWHDADGVMHRLLSPRRIEQEIADIAHHLRPLLPALRGVVSQNDKAQSVETANPAIRRLSVLQVDLERFAREQKEREENEWHVWETERRRPREAQ